MQCDVGRYHAAHKHRAMIILPPEGKIVPVEPFVIECRAFLAGSIVTEIKNGKYPQCTLTYMKYIWVRVDEGQLNVDNKNLPK